MRNNVYIFGEMHTKEDRDRVEKEIRELHKNKKIKFLLTEELGPFRAYSVEEKESGITSKRFSNSDRSYKLALELSIPVIGIDIWDDKIFINDKKKSNGEYLDCSESFKLRELRMVSVIKEMSAAGGCAVIVGDIHLRGLPNVVTGGVSSIQKEFLNNPKVKIYRSPFSETKDNDIVQVSGDDFNLYAYNRMIDLGNLLLSDEVQYEDLEQRTRSGLSNMPYKRDDFMFKDKYNFCKVIDNEIVSIVQAFFSTKTYIWLGPIYTDESHRGKGYVRDIFNELFSRYPKNKYGYGLTVIPNNRNAVKLYEKIGFKPAYVTMKL